MLMSAEVEGDVIRSRAQAAVYLSSIRVRARLFGSVQDDESLVVDSTVGIKTVLADLGSTLLSGGIKNGVGLPRARAGVGERVLKRVKSHLNCAF